MKESILEQMISRHRRQPLLVDANVLLLHFIGSFGRDLVGRFKRTAHYRPRDFDLLQRLMSMFPGIITTPNILTEVSNLAGQIADRLKTEFFHALQEGIQVLDERFVASGQASRTDGFAQFGLTDSAIRLIAADGFLVLTDDGRLYHWLLGNAIDAINFNHIRQWD